MSAEAQTTTIVVGQIILGIEIAVGIGAIIASVYAVGKWLRCQTITYINPYVKSLGDSVEQLQKDLKHIESRIDNITDSRQRDDKPRWRGIGGE